MGYLLKNGLALIFIAYLISGCASGPKIYVNEDPSASFAGYQTYSFQPDLGTDRPGYESILSNYLKSAVGRELQSRGYREAGAKADLTINFYVHTSEKVRTTQSVSSGGYGYYGYRRGFYDPWAGYPAVETEVRQYTEGTLTIDLIDARTGRLVWEGTAVGTVREKMRENLQSTIDAVVTDIFSRYPYMANGSAP